MLVIDQEESHELWPANKTDHMCQSWRFLYCIHEVQAVCDVIHSPKTILLGRKGEESSTEHQASVVIRQLWYSAGVQVTASSVHHARCGAVPASALHASLSGACKWTCQAVHHLDTRLYRLCCAEKP